MSVAADAESLREMQAYMCSISRILCCLALGCKQALSRRDTISQVPGRVDVEIRGQHKVTSVVMQKRS